MAVQDTISTTIISVHVNEDTGNCFDLNGTFVLNRRSS